METGKNYQLVIIGAGPAGLAASIYAARFGIEHVVIGALSGGQISESHLIDNYPGIEDATGFEFVQKWVHHVQKYGTEIMPLMVRSVQKNAEGFAIDLGNDKKIQSQTLLLAAGTKRRKLGIKGEDELTGKGVSYCATCDGFFYKQKTVAVIGGNDSAAGAALYLADIVEKVFLIYRGEKLRCENHWTELIAKNPKVEVLYKTNVVEIVGTEKVVGAKLDNPHHNQTEIAIDGLFIEAGSDPSVDLPQSLGTEMDEQGYVKIKSDASTSVAGVWAAGDITDGSDKFRQVITAAAEGAIAARSISNYLKK
ncbi:MAG: FAD-dependent oxidoreductase [Parcubacteria group bacterium]|jgi:thioredoxin reductase (NADPH)